MIQVFIELGDVILGRSLEGITVITFALIVLATLEIWSVVRLWKDIQTTEK